MLRWLTRTPSPQTPAQLLYAAIVDQARQPEFYGVLGVPDTVEGRFELIALHMGLVLDRLSSDGAEGLELGRALNEAFITDMDDNMREIGVGDLTVPKKVKKAAAAVFDWARSLRAALAEPTDKALEAVLAINVHVHGSTTKQTIAVDADLTTFAAYVRATAADLKITPAARLAEGHVRFPTPVLPTH